MPQRVNCTGRDRLQPPKGSGNCPRLNGLYAHMEFCDQYYYCRMGIPLLITCPAGLVYDVKAMPFDLNWTCNRNILIISLIIAWIADGSVWIPRRGSTPRMHAGRGLRLRLPTHHEHYAADIRRSLALPQKRRLPLLFQVPKERLPPPWRMWIRKRFQPD